MRLADAPSEGAVEDLGDLGRAGDRPDLPVGHADVPLQLAVGARPVEILNTVLGRPGTDSQLQRIVRVTNGKVWPVTSAAEIPQIFYRAFGRRICQPHCPR